MKKARHVLRWILLAVICCASFAAHAATVNIEGLTPICEIGSSPLFQVNSSSIIVSFSSGEFMSVYIDGVQVAYNSSYFSEYEIDLSGYLDDQVHELRLQRSSTKYSTCYFTNNSSTSSEDGIYYIVIDGEAKVISSDSDLESATILSEYEYDGTAYPVTTICNSAFDNRSSLKELEISNSVTSIETYAFRYCNNLRSVVIPPSVISLGSNTFGGCSGLVKNALPSGLSNPFPYGLNIEYAKDCFIDENNVIYNADKTTVYYAPMSLSDTYHVPESVTSIGASAFYKCTSLTSVAIPESVTSIGTSAFKDCSSLTSLTFNAVDCASCGSSGYPAFPSSIRTLSIGDKVTKIPAYFLYGGSYFNSVTIPNSVTSIGSYAFRNNTSLKSVIIPLSVTYIASDAFSGCSYMSKNAYPTRLSNPFPSGVNIKYPVDCYFDENNVIFDADKTIVYFAPISLSSYNIPESVTSIGESAFYNCASLTSVIIPESVTSIGESAFKSCSSLTSLTFNATKCTTCGSSSYPAFPSSIGSLTFGNKVTKIPAYFLYNGSNIESVTIPNSVTSMGDYAFRKSSKLRSITFGSGLLSIASNTFSDCKIAKAFWLGNTPPEGVNKVSAKINYVANSQYSFSDKLIYQFLSSKFVVDGTVYVPVSPSDRTCDVVDCQYDSERTEVTIADKVSNRGIEMSVNNVCQYAFYDNQYIQTLELSNKGDIGDYAFDECDNLLSANVSNVGSIGRYAFRNLTKLADLTLGQEVTAIMDDAFYGCSSIPRVSIPNTVTQLGTYTFSGCKSLESVEIGTGVPELPNYTFYGCSSLASIRIPNNVGSIGNYVFGRCTSLADFSIEDAAIQDDNQSAQSFPDWTSTNHQDNSTSHIEYSFDAVAGDYLTFNYFVDSESGYDKLIVKINDVEILSESGSKSGNCRHDFSSSGIVKLYIAYVKDSSNSSGKDEASVTDIYLDGRSTIDFITLGSNGSSPMFADCPLDDVYIGRKLSYDSSSSKGYSPFYRNTSLRTVEITDAETQVYDNEFYGCSNLKTLKIGNGVTAIGKWAFSGCSSLDYFSAGYMVESIGEEAFSDCTGLTKYYSYSINPPVCGSQALDDINKWDCTLYVPANSSDEYKAAAQWKEFFFVDEMDAVLVAEIRLNETEIMIEVGETFQLTAEILPSNATDQSLSWQSSNENVVTVDQNGEIKAVGIGHATITVSSNDGNGVYATCSVIVDDDSGVADIVIEEDEYVQIYNICGGLIYEGEYSNSNLSPGVYVIVSNGSVIKRVIR